MRAIGGYVVVSHRERRRALLKCAGLVPIILVVLVSGSEVGRVMLAHGTSADLGGAIVQIE